MPSHGVHPPRQRGLSLIELLTGMAITGVLAGLTYPAYQSTLLKLRRSEALALAAQVQLAQERHRSQQTRFATLSELGQTAASASGRYRLSEATPSARGYTLTLVAQGGQAADTACRHLQLKVDGHDTRWSSGPDAEVGNTDQDNRRCWAQ